MALSEVILLERVANLGQMGDLVSVRPGYARNFLLPTGKAIRATAANKKRFEEERVQLEARNLGKREEAERLAERLTGFSVILIRQAGEAGNLYGSVTPRDIAEAITEAAANVSRQQVILEEPIKALGLVSAKVRLHPEVELTVTVNVARSQEEAERQARGEAIVVEEDENVLQGLQEENLEEGLAEENIEAEHEQAEA